jgi:hypothetical protein
MMWAMLQRRVLAAAALVTGFLASRVLAIDCATTPNCPAGTATCTRTPGEPYNGCTTPPAGGCCPYECTTYTYTPTPGGSCAQNSCTDCDPYTQWQFNAHCTFIPGQGGLCVVS